MIGGINFGDQIQEQHTEMKKNFKTYKNTAIEKRQVHP